MEKLIHMPLADVVSNYPEMTTVLQSYQINLHEDQSVNLAQLFNGKKLPHAEFLRDVQAALIASVCAQYKSLDVAGLVSEIITRFHEVHRAQMAGLINDARYIEKKYAGHNSCPQGLSGLLIEFLDDLASHMDQEELFLFPALASAGSFNMFPQLAVAHHSHDRHLDMMAKLVTITNHLIAPNDASIQWQELYENLMEFILQLNMHIAIENQLLLTD